MIIRLIEAIKEAMFRPLNTAAIGILGAFSMLWGLWVGNPWWSVFEQAQIFRIMDHIADEWFWGSLAFGVGFYMIWGVARGTYRSLRNGSLAGFYFWLFAAICFFIGDWKNTGGITLTMICLYCGYVALNLTTNKEYFLEK